MLFIRENSCFSLGAKTFVIYEFENYALDVAKRELRCDGHQMHVEPQTFDVLQYLLVNRERVVSKDDLIAGVWKGRIVSESTLSSSITTARKALGTAASRSGSSARSRAGAFALSEMFAHQTVSAIRTRH